MNDKRLQIAGFGHPEVLIIDGEYFWLLAMLLPMMMMMYDVWSNQCFNKQQL